MNRHERRRARKLAQNNFYRDYIQHLPQVPLTAPLEGLSYAVFFHDPECHIYNDGGLCNCQPLLKRFSEPSWS